MKTYNIAIFGYGERPAIWSVSASAVEDALIDAAVDFTMEEARVVYGPDASGAPVLVNTRMWTKMQVAGS